MRKSFAFSISALLLYGCGGGGGSHSSGTTTIPVADHLAAALGVETDATGVATTHLATFQTNSPSTFLTDVVVTGVDAGDTLAAIDQRPSNGVLYAVGKQGTLYTLAPATGVATKVGATNPIQLFGTVADMDFDPATDQIRLVGFYLNTRLDPATGALVANDTVDNDAQLNGIAYSPSGTLFGYSYAVAHRAQLVKIATPSAGIVSSDTNATLPFFAAVSGNNPLNQDGMDISADGKTAILGSFGLTGSSIVLVDLASGRQASVAGTPAGRSFQIVSVAFVDPVAQSTASRKG